MKNSTLLAIILFSTISYSQIGKVENLKEPTIIGYDRQMRPRTELTRIEDDTKLKKLHMISYQNEKYSNLSDNRTLSFYADENELEELFQIFLDVISNNKEQTFTLGDDRILAIGKSKVLTIFVSNDAKTDSYFRLNKKMLLKLFGKK